MNQHFSNAALSLTLAGVAGYLLCTAQARWAVSLKQLAQLETHLTSHNEQIAQANAATLHTMGWYVCREHNQASDLAVMQQSHQIQARTQPLADTLRQLRQQFSTGHATAARLRRLPALLDTYTRYIQQFVPEAVPLTHPSRQGELVGWAGEFSLATAPVGVATAHLTYLENRVRQYESEALQHQASKVGDRGDYFNWDQPLAIATSETVAPGSTYEAQLFMTRWERSPYCTETFFANTIELRERSRLADNWLFGWGLWASSRQFTYPIPPAKAGQPDTVRAQWQGTIRATGYLRDTVLTVRVPYLIVKRPAR